MKRKAAVRDVGRVLSEFLHIVREAVKFAVVAVGQGLFGLVQIVSEMFRYCRAECAVFYNEGGFAHHGCDALILGYWSEVSVQWVDEHEVAHAVDRLLKVERPFSAFHAAHFHLKSLPAKTLYQLLDAVGQSQAREAERYRLNSHYLTHSGGCCSALRKWVWL